MVRIQTELDKKQGNTPLKLEKHVVKLGQNNLDALPSTTNCCKAVSGWAGEAKKHSLSLFWKIPSWPCKFCQFFFTPCRDTHITKSWTIKLFDWQKISTSRIKLIWKRNTTATNATTQPLRPATWKGTSWFIVVRSLSRAHSASILVEKLAA